MARERIVPGDVLRRAIDLLFAHFALLYPLALIFCLVQAMVTFAVQDTNAAGIGTFVGLIASTFLTGIVVGFVRDVEAGLAPGEEPSVGALFAAVAPFMGRLLLVSLLATIGITLGIVAFIVPGIWLFTMWAVVAPVVVLEQRDVLGTFRRSRELVRGNGREVFLTLLLLILLLVPAAFVALVAIDALGDAGGAFVGVLFSALVTTLTVVATSTLYFRLLDVERSAAAPAPHPGDAWTSTGTNPDDARRDDSPADDAPRDDVPQGAPRDAAPQNAAAQDAAPGTHPAPPATRD